MLDASVREAEVQVMPNAVLPPAGRDLSRIAAEIRSWHRKREYAMDRRIGADNALRGFLLQALGWSKKLPADERSAIKNRVKELQATADKIIRAEERFRKKEEAGKTRPGDTRKEIAGENSPDYLEWAELIETSVLTRRPWDKIEADAGMHMEALAMELPVFSWAENIRGFGALSLAQIIAETGLVSCDKHLPGENGNYPNPGKLWKRMGVAVMGDVRQGGLRKGASKEDWMAHGYSGERRAVLAVIGGNLVMLNKCGYREAYLARKQYERDKAEAEGLIVLPSADIEKAIKKLKLSKAGQAAEYKKYRSAGHIEKRARRYMEKRLLRDVWRAWREAIRKVTSIDSLPPA